MQQSSYRLHAWAARPCIPLLGSLLLQRSMSSLHALVCACKAAAIAAGSLNVSLLGCCTQSCPGGC